jgi:hypothetical protein
MVRIASYRRVTLFRSLAGVGAYVASGGGVAEESEDPWLCVPGFRSGSLLWPPVCSVVACGTIDHAAWFVLVCVIRVT